MDEQFIKEAFAYGGMICAKHIKTGNIYHLTKMVKMKINGSWGVGVYYIGNGQYVRDINDFSGFEYLYNETGLK